MILVWLIVIPLLGGLAAWLAGAAGRRAPRWICMVALAADLGLAIGLWLARPAGPSRLGIWLEQFRAPWIPGLGIGFHLAVDGLSLLMITLTLFMGLLAVGCSWREIQDRVGFFHLNLMWILAGILGVFMALDLFLFYFFWELMLVPMYFLIGIWGHGRRIYAAMKFFIFTQASGLLMLVSILGLFFVHWRATGVGSFDYLDLLGTPLAPATATWLMLGFFAAFAVKLPAFPLHSWLPDAHTEAPTAGSLILAGLLLKTGAYGLLRFALPLFPAASERFAPVAVLLGVIGILYGAVLAFAQTNLKRLVAYTSVSHLGFVLVGIYAWNRLALQGVVAQMVCHAFSTGGLFILAGALHERTHTHDLDRLGGLSSTVPRMGAAGMVLAMASLGLPGLGNFVAEFLTLVGAWKAYPGATALAALGLIASTVYALRIVQRVFHGPNSGGWALPDLSLREVAIMAAVIVPLVWIGLWPQTMLDAVNPTLAAIQSLLGRAS